MSVETKYVPRLYTKYREEVVPQLINRFGYKNPMEVPKIVKIVVNMGVGEAVGDINQLERAIEDLRAITGQQPAVRRAKKSEAGFKLRKGMPVGLKVTLRKERMWDFLDKLISLAFPSPKPTNPLLSPTITRALKENLFPPFVTLVVLLAYISLSSICSWSSISAIL